MAVKKKPTGNANKKPAGTTGGGSAVDEEEEEEEEEGGEPKPLTMDDVNKAITDRFQRFQKKLPGTIEKSMTAVLAKAGFTPKKPGDEEEEEEEEGDEEQEQGQQGGKGKAQQQPAQPPAQQPPPKAKPDKKVAKLEKELAEIKQKQADDAARVAREQEQSQLAQVLPGLNVRPELVAPLTTYLRSEEGGRLVRRNAEGKVVFVAPDEDGDLEELGLKEGLTAWLKTPAGKAYVAPTNAQGSGATPAGKAPGVRTGDPSKSEMDKELFAAFSGVGGFPGT